MDNKTYIQTQIEALATGTETKEFIQTRVGKMLIGRAERKQYQALMELALTDPTDSGKIATLQVEALGPISFIKWLNAAMNEGDGAEFTLKQMESGKVNY